MENSSPIRNARIYQIFYSAQTREQLDPGFIPLDNTGQRSDWFEYWPMRKFLLNNTLDDDTFYGFLSPRFKDKTGLSAAQVYDFVGATDPSVDVISFSPYFDLMALYRNCFYQGFDAHPDSGVLESSIKLLMPDIDLNTLIMTSQNMIFCNYFLSRPPFWRRWLELTEKLFEIAEQNDTPLGRALNAGTNYRDGSTVSIKSFVIERLASLLLATEKHWKSRAFSPRDLPLSRERLEVIHAAVLPELEALDALKKRYNETGQESVMRRYDALVKRFKWSARIKRHTHKMREIFTATSRA